MQSERLDKRLVRETGLTRSRIEKLIREGFVLVNGQAVAKPGFLVLPEDSVKAEIPEPVPLLAVPENIEIAILYEDAHIAVIDKACGMVVHPAAGNETGTLVNALLYHLKGLSGIGGVLRPGIVHRLDKDTSGVLLVAKTDETHLALSDAFKQRRIRKEYIAVVDGSMKADAGKISLPIARHPQDRKKMAVIQNGKEAITKYKVIARTGKATALHVDLITGRTHQIRVHCAHLGHPIVGDGIYGHKRAQDAAPRLMLHAWRIRFTHPVTGEEMCCEAEIPKEFQKFLVKN